MIQKGHDFIGGFMTFPTPPQESHQPESALAAENGERMRTNHIKRRPSLPFIFLFWTLIALTMTSKTLWDHFFGDETCFYLPRLAAQLPQYGFWALVSPWLLQIPSSPSFLKRDLWRRAFFLTMLGIILLLLLGILNGVSHNIFVHWVETWHNQFGWYWKLFLGQTYAHIMIYFAVMSFAFAWDYFHQSKQQALREVQLENQLTQARLQALQIQLQPHFLFNTLNTISALVGRDPTATKRVVARLSQLLRKSLDSTQEQTVPLHQELAFLEGYIEIIEIRFSGRLTFQLEIEPSCLSCMVPNLLLQPLVENAIKHGFHRMPRDAKIYVGARIMEDRLHLCVFDNGCGTDLAHLKLGLGLGNLKDRLTNLYGETCYWEIGSKPEGGLSIDMFLPVIRSMSQDVGNVTEGLAECG